MLFAWPKAALAQESTGTLAPLPSVAEPDGINALLYNPSGLATLRAWEVRIINTQLEGHGEGTALLYGMPVFGPISLGAGLEVLRPPDADTRVKLSLGMGLRLHKAFRIGFTWSHLFADLEDADGLDTLDIGVLVRLADWVSLGAVVRDTNTPVIGGRILQRRYAFGASFQPGTDRVGIEIGAEAGERDGTVDAIARLRFEPVRGFEVISHARLQPRDDEFGFVLGVALGFHFGAAGIEGGAFVGMPPGGDIAYQGFTVAARIGGAHQGPLFRRGGKTLTLDVASTSEVPRPGLTGEGFTFTHLVSFIDSIRKDPTVDGLLIRDKRSSFGWAQSEELRQGILALKKAGKRVTVYLDQGDLRHLLVYSAADRIVLNPAGGLMITGLRSVVTFYRQALDNLRIPTQWVKFGKYKSYPEAFERTSPSKAALEVRNSLLDTLYTALLTRIGAGRKLTSKQMRQIIDEGPFLASEAKAKGLVDHVAFYDEVAAWMKKDQGRTVRLVRARRAPTRARERWGNRPAIAVIPIQGSIVEGRSNRVPLLGTQNVGSTTIVPAVKAAAASPRVKGILLRVNSPGGSSVASDLMHRAIQQAAKRKPVVVSFGNVAASGGYYLAMGAKEVFSDDLTITGSIGIFTGKPAFGQVLAFLGIGRHTITRGKRANLFGTDKPWTPDELALMKRKVRAFYDLFLKRVADNRKMTATEVDKLAQGRVWLGSQARERKLVDHRGGVVAALRRIKVLAGLGPDTPTDLVFLPRAGLIQRVRNTLGIEVQAILARMGNLQDALALAYPFLNGFKPGEPLALMPFHLRFE